MQKHITLSILIISGDENSVCVSKYTQNDSNITKTIFMYIFKLNVWKLLKTDEIYLIY